MSEDKFSADYDGKCESCDSSPTVVVVTKQNITWNTNMCGPCMFGEASCADPKEWVN